VLSPSYWAQNQVRLKLEAVLLRASVDRRRVRGRRQLLSARETAVIAAAGRGLTTKQVAAELGISRNTAAFHLANVYRKLRAHSRVEALNAYSDLIALSRLDSITHILRLGTRLATHISSPAIPVRATYFRIADGMVKALVELDAMGLQVSTSFPLAEHPFMREIAATLRPIAGQLASRPMNSMLSELAASARVTSGAGVAIAPGGSVHGILSIAARGPELPPDALDRLVEVGEMVELGLAGALRP
jgi:DNA-binding CsgD family transcriptional regulator